MIAQLLVFIFNSRNIRIAIGRKKIISKEKQDVVNLLSDGNLTLEIAKKMRIMNNGKRK